MQINSTQGTFTVATVLCVVCSFLVAGTAAMLKGRIEKEKELDRQKNILIAAELAEKGTSAEDVQTIYGDNIEEAWIDLSSGRVVAKSDLPGGEKYDSKKASKDAKLQVPVTDNALMGIKFREPYAAVYKIKSGGYVLPIYGKGLWGTLWGFLAMEDDAQTVKGITFYEHKETPGLGAEVESEKFQSQWPGKLAFNPDGDVQLAVKKGETPEGTPAHDYTIDGLSGATITTKGVDHMVKYWLGDNGFGKYLAAQH